MRTRSWASCPFYLTLITSTVRALPLPPAPILRIIPLPVKLAGGLFLFQTSVQTKDQPFCDEILAVAQTKLRDDPIITMELGTCLEAGGVFSSSSSESDSIRQLVMEFQINGGNSWAQAKVHGIKVNQNPVRLVSLEVSNMDAVLMKSVTPFRVKLSAWDALI